MEQSETACYFTSKSPESSYSRNRVSSVRRATPRLELRHLLGKYLVIRLDHQVAHRLV
jgi:hypothetical protein